MSWIAAAVVGGTVVGGVYSANKQAGAAKDAAGAQSQAAQLGIEEQRRQFDAVRELLNPYVNAGTGALGAQQNLLGLNGADAQATAINGLQASPQFHALQKQGNDAILANASATGGLRGGNTQAALAQFSPNLLNSLIQQQYANLGGMTSLGQNAAAGVGNAGMQTGANVANLLGQQGAAQAGASLAQGRAYGQMANSITGAFGSFAGMGGLGRLGGMGASSGSIENMLF
jgi:hypothetical protein